MLAHPTRPPGVTRYQANGRGDRGFANCTIRDTSEGGTIASRISRHECEPAKPGPA